MTTTLHTPLDEDVAPVRRQTFGTLLRVEMRKLADTRSGRILLASAVAVSAAALAYKVARVGADVQLYRNYSKALLPAVTVLVPLVALVAMTGEWTQRTALTTFTMSPRRLRVIGAKFLASLALSAVVLAAVTLLTFAATAAGGAVSGSGASYDGVAMAIRETLVVTMLQVVMAAAFGALIPVTAVAVGTFIMAPTVWAIAGPELFGRSARWLDVFESYDRLGSRHPWEHLGQSATSIAVWVVVPAALGVWRSLRREVK